MREITVALLGAPAVGKSTFIGRALELRQSPEGCVSSRKMSIDGVVYNVRLLEIAPGTVEIKGDRTIRWPKVLDDRAMPSVDGALTLYDVTNASSIDKVPELLSEPHPVILFLLFKGLSFVTNLKSQIMQPLWSLRFLDTLAYQYSRCFQQSRCTMRPCLKQM